MYKSITQILLYSRILVPLSLATQFLRHGDEICDANMEPSQGSARVPCLLPFLQFYSLFIFISLPLGLKDFFGSALQQKNFLQFAVWHALRLMTDLPNEIVLGQAKDLCKRAQGIRENLQQSTAARSLGPKAHWAEPEQAQAEAMPDPPRCVVSCREEVRQT